MMDGWLMLGLLLAIAGALVWLSSYGERQERYRSADVIAKERRALARIEWEDFAAQQARRWRPVEPSYPPSGPTATIPAKDQDFEALPPGIVASVSTENDRIDALTSAWAADLSCMIKYKDAAESVSVRRISVSGLSRKYGYLYLSCYCHERRAPRSFRVDRIIDAWDSSTGEIINIPAWAEEIASAARTEVKDEPVASVGNTKEPKEGARTPYGRCADGLRVLRFLATVDKHEHRDEMRAIEDYMRVMCDGTAVGLPPVSVDTATQAKWISRQNPTPASFLTSARKVFAESSAHAALVVDCALRVIEADGAITPEEGEAYARLKAIRDRVNARLSTP
jgi:hypothetical protein